MSIKERSLWLGAVAVLTTCTVLSSGVGRVESARVADEGKATGGCPAYSVVDTEASNLIVVDNRSNTLYFYTIDKDAEIGSDLKLRGSIDLNEVGKPTLRPKPNGRTGG